VCVRACVCCEVLALSLHYRSPLNVPVFFLL
jgi:hypothetical protein